ncbi:uncharacterized protein KQ657_001658 [Scheffersomyces spartinae]|uniref:Uncharacterized protein n=1 Tax=Scheffersomyces spartinae TaxID=45513 RepID=A0A9P7V783_9ASCO|nr:uncharacterized protein KQ657_001658 [Scheffersomyces spartinae]KAG7192559.1 hypothetical protein KQ657_001658 [Scheffersomyces spartinae]
MVWPFGSKEKDVAEIKKELPIDLQEFFDEANPKPHSSIFEPSPKQKLVEQILLENEKTAQYSHELDDYKRQQNAGVVLAVNCSEIRMQMLECVKQWKFMGEMNQCSDFVNKYSACDKIQKDALKHLFYDDCYKVEQCKRIRYAVDLFFVKNFGRYGEDVNEETKAKFDDDIDKAFYRVWKK